MFSKLPIKAKVAASRNVSPFAVEPLEGRQLLSASGHHGHTHAAGHHGGSASNSITFSQAPQAVQDGLTALASTDNVTAPTATQKVLLADPNGIETYSIVVTGSGSITRLTVDVNGKAVTAPTKSTTTFGAIGNAAVTDEINAIATALDLVAPTSTDSVNVVTPSSGAVTYSIRLSDSAGYSGRTVTVDANGNPVGNQSIPFSTLPASLQAALNANAPTGATALAADSTQTVRVRTANSITTYSTVFTSSGTETRVTVNINGVLTPKVTTFGAIPDPAKTELQTLATAAGITTTIADTQSVNAYDEGNGTTIYTVTLSGTNATTSRTFTVTLASDQAGNPTAPPGEGSGRGGCGGGGFGAGNFEGGGFFSGFSNGSSSSSSSSSGASSFRSFFRHH